MLFKLTNKNSDRMTHCGVLEFVADEGICYLPHWVSCLMLDCQNLKSRISKLPSLIIRRWNVSWQCLSLLVMFYNSPFSSGSGCPLQKFNLARQTAFNVHLTVLPEIEYTQELIYTGERFENIRHIDRALCVCFHSCR